MARKLTKEQAVVEIDKWNSLIQRVDEVISLNQEYKSEFIKTVSIIKTKGLFDALCSKEILEGKDKVEDFPDIIKLLKLIHVLNNNIIYLRRIESYRKKEIESIRLALDYISKRTDNRKWFFLPAKEKKLSVQAYQFLTGDNGSYIDNDLENSIINMILVNNVSTKYVLKHYYSNKQEYTDIIDQYFADVISKQSDIYGVKKLAEKHISILDKLKSYSKKNNIYQDEIYLEINNYIEVATLEKMQNVPLTQVIDIFETRELEQLGVSLKDIYKGNFDKLSDANLDTLTMLHEISLKYYEDISNSVKIRLSIDNQDNKSTRLVTKLYQAISLENVINDAKQLLLLNQLCIENRIDVLLNVTNGLKWLNYDREEKNNILKSYLFLREKMKGEYYKEYRKLIERKKELKTANAQDAWDDYKANTIKYATLLERACGKQYDGRANNSPDVSNEDIINILSLKEETRTEKVVKQSYGLSDDLALEVNSEEFNIKGLKCDLRPYQVWGVKFIIHQKKVLLGDEMGLGKTIQALACMIHYKNAGASHFLVICPASVLENWYMEVTEKSVLNAIKVYGGNKRTELYRWREEGGVAITTYETVKSLDFSENIKINMMVVDEAHYVKNPNAQRTIAVKNLAKNIPLLLFMTGTALENRVDEMKNIISILDESLSSSIHIYKGFYLSKYGFKELVEPIYYRRKRDDVLNELPELIEMNEWCDMTPEDRIAYDKCIMEKNYMQMRRISWNTEDYKKSSKANRLLEIIGNVEKEKRKIIIFSFFLDTLDRLYKFLGDRCMQPINGSVSPQRRQEIIKEFENASDGSVLLAQIQTGGTGLNIQAASVVIICEPQYKPSTENQAISRSYRMGQNRNVLVFRLLCRDSIDEQIVKILADKQKLFELYADKSNSADRDLEKIKAEEKLDKAINDKTINEIWEKEYKALCKSKEAKSFVIEDEI